MIQHPLTYWLLYSHSPTANKVSITQLLEHYRDPEHFINENIKSFNFLKDTNWSAIKKALLWAEDKKHHILTFSDAAYPPLLKEITHPPPILYIWGNLDTVRLPQLAIVGSRHPSHSGLAITKHFTKDIAMAGLCITSGLALGIDAISHQAALDAGGQTIAVLGNGLDSIYPKRHISLAHVISNQGCVISEFPLEAQPNRKHFPQRNRIISGLSLGTLVIEAKRQSGSLITAHYAAEQGREVFAVPGSIRHSLSRGCHQLLREGAMLTESASDILNALDISPLLQSHSTAISDSKRPLSGLDPEQRHLLACVDYEETSIDEVIERTGLNAPTVARMLLNLELHGYICPASRGYTRVR